MSKRGCVLHYAFINAAHNVVKNNATFEAKRAESQTHHNALGHCAGKLVSVI
jgi:transposase